MSGNKQSPRQKLINMMYLVLTAMLALNISKEILDSFITLDESQITSRQTVEKELEFQLATFRMRAEEKPLKFAEPFEAADQISRTANDIVSHINLIKATCIAETEGREMDEVYNPEMDTVLQVKHVLRKDDYDVPTNVLYGSGEQAAVTMRRGDTKNLRATDLRARLDAFKSEVSELAPSPNLTASMDKVFNFSDRYDSEGDLQSWEYINFYHQPIAAMQTLLSKMQMDIRAAELEAIDNLFNDVEGRAMKFTRLTDAVIPVTNDVSQGGVFQAEVFLAAYDDTNPPEIRLAAPGARVDEESLEITGDYELLAVDSNMIGGVAIPANELGAQHREGLIIFRPAGLPEVRKKFVLDYQVSAPTAMVNPTNMNVLYKGVDNPITVGVPGYRAEDIRASIDNGTLSRQSGAAYVAKVTSGSIAKVRLTVELPDGGTRTLAPVEFRLKSVPDPMAIFGGKTAKDSRITKAQLRAAQGVRAEIEGFLFPVSFTVLSFDITTMASGQPITHASEGRKLSENQNILLDQVRSGQVVSIESIFVRAPDGTRRKLAAINLRVN